MLIDEYDTPLQAASAQEALTQLQERRYETVLQQKGITQILQIGMAFRGKEVELISNYLTKP